MAHQVLHIDERAFLLQFALNAQALAESMDIEEDSSYLIRDARIARLVLKGKTLEDATAYVDRGDYDV